MINPESSSPEPQAQSGFAEALKIIEQKYGISTTDLGGQKEKIRKSISAEIEQLLTENFRIPAAVLMAKINEISRQLKPMELQLVNSMAMDIRAGRQVGNFDSLMMQMSMFDGDGSGRGGLDRKGRSFRAELVVLCVLLMLLLVACMPGVPVVGVGPVVVNEQGTPQSGLVVPAENTAIPPTKTAIPATATEAPTQTPTEVVIPDFMKEFIEKGYGVWEQANLMYAHLKGAKPHAASNPIEFRGVTFYSWITGVSYVDQNGVTHTDGIIPDGICARSTNDFIFDLSGSSQISHAPNCPSSEFFKNQRLGIDQFISSNDSYIVQLQLGVGEDTQTERSELYSQLFPTAEPVEIPGIGTVLPVTRVRFVGFDVPAK